MKSRVAMVAAAALVLAGCGSSEWTEPPQQTQTLTPSGFVDKPTIGFRVGAEADLESDDGVRARVAVDAARSVVGSTVPTPAGQRLFAVHVTLTNTGRSAATMDWGSDALDDTHPNGGPTHAPADVPSVDVGPLLPYPLRLGPRQTAVGWVAYLMPTDTLVVAVDFGVGEGQYTTAHWAMTSQR